MPEVQKCEGMFTWADVNSPNQADAKAFYCELFSWNAIDVEAGGQNTYTMFQKDGKTVAGLGPQPESMKGLPAMWTSYITVGDVDNITARVRELGGTVAVQPMDVMDAGRMALIQDPTGAAVALWQTGNHDGAEIFNEPGAMTWNELATRNVTSAKGFFEQLLGWKVQAGDVGDGTLYTGIFLDGDHPNGGMVEMDETWPENLPPHWLTYFSVDDVDAVAQKVQALGGKVTVEPQDIPVGRFSVLSDPHGGTFAVISTNQP
ncbi:MAG: VOC family protein [Trueperaceae bacterium]|nr:MAG: VOC family protein [Trueperaceae bacterium]